MGVIRASTAGRIAIWLSLGWSLACSLLGAEAKPIRLRNETIQTPLPSAARAALQAVTPAAPIAGLYLLQFTAPLQPPWRSDLAGRGVQLLRYVPDDAFVVHLAGIRLDELQSLPYVRWVGPYEPRHKLDPRLTRQLAARPPGTALPIKLLVSPHANAVEVTLLTRSFRPLTQRRSSALGTTLAGEVRSAQLAALLHSPLVLWIEPAPRMKLLDEVASKIVGGDPGTPATLATVQQLGYDGRGVTVAVADSGLDSGDPDTMHPDLNGRVDAFFAYGGLPDASDEHSHGTHCAGIVAGNAATGEIDDSGSWWGLGVAPGAHLVVQRIFDGVGEYYPPASFEQLTHDAVRSGAVVGSNSWGDDTQGQYDLSAAEFDALVRDADAFTPGEQPYVLEFSAGNSGPGRQTIGSPAVAKNVIATGACQNNRFEFPIYGDGQEVTADFSSRGPCEDGRIKPDLMAPGTWIASLKSQYAGDENAWSPIDEYYLYQGGTSQAGPHAAGAAAVFVQYYRETHGQVTPSPAMVKAALINSATDMGTGYIPDDDGELIAVGDTGPVPNQDEGWGRVDLPNLIDSSRRYQFTEQGAGLRTGQVLESRIVVSPNDTLKITLVYTDFPALPAAVPALVNDLDLEVTAPDGKLFRGNAFLDGEGVSGTPAGDRINNVEAVHLAQPLPGEYVIRVRGMNVVEDVHHRTNRPPEQDFVLVVSGDLPRPGEGIVYFDREVYPAPVVARIHLIDQQLVGQPNATVTVTSTTEPAGETVQLKPSGGPGAFTNSIRLVSGTAVAGDGLMQVAHGDTVAVHYQDANPPVDRVGEAGIDLLPPVLTDIAPTNKFGRTTIRWQSDEPATSTVVFGPTTNQTQAVTNPGLTESHRVELPALEAGSLYYYYVVSADAAGNTSTNDNQGKWFTFTGTQAATALFVYAPEIGWDEGFGGFFGTYPGIENWTVPLDQLGVPYETWNTEERGGRAPTVQDLLPFKVVVWRPEELGEVTAGMTEALTAYLNQGGSLLVCSLDLLSRLSLPSDQAFKTNVLHVAGFQEDQGAFTVAGESGDPVGGGLELALDYSQFPDASLIGIDWPLGTDYVRPTADATPCFRQADDGSVGPVVGVRFPKTGVDSPSRVVFCGFPFEAVPLEAEAPNNRVTFLANALEFLVPGLRGLANIAFDRPAYTVPGAALIEVTDTKRAAENQIQIEISAPNEPTPKALTLERTVRPGVFRGLVKLLAANAPSEAGALRVRNGDAIAAKYVDTVQREALAGATVDTSRPVISLMLADPAYNEATITWETDKPADALVQFNTTDFQFPVNRTAYLADLGLSHEIQLSGLLPDREYFFLVVSRDQAGNSATDDNAGDLYRFRTLKPKTPPWSDDLEQGKAGWAVFNDDQAVDEETGENLLNSGWQYGQPVNTEDVHAYSGVSCWATNLNGDPVDLAISDLISPAIDLTGGNKATFRFWQYYDFTERSELLDIEAGQVAISTDNGATWNLIYTVTDEFSLGWEQVEVDISKYAGHVVRFVWDYQMFSFDEYPRTGWLIDDVSVTLGLAPAGQVTVSNDLEQAAFKLTGPISLNGTGTWLRLTNAPAGEYVVQWSPVEFYLTPVPQTNTVATSTPGQFVGHYTFPDVNRDGISDLFEQKYFHAVDPAHRPETDSDRDGRTDLDEFLSGTDPTDPASRLAVTRVGLQPNRTVRVEWLSVPGHSYRLQLTTDLVEWFPASEWIRATGNLAAASLPPLTGSATFLFRVEVRP